MVNIQSVRDRGFRRNFREPVLTILMKEEVKEMSALPFWATPSMRRAAEKRQAERDAAVSAMEDCLDKVLARIAEVLPQLHSYEPGPSVDDSEYYVVSQAQYAGLVRGIGSSLLGAELAILDAWWSLPAFPS